MPVKVVNQQIPEIDPQAVVTEKKPRRILKGAIVLPGGLRSTIVDAAQPADVRRGLKSVERGE